MTEEKVDRRRYIKYVGGAAAGIAVGAVATYLATRPGEGLITTTVTRPTTQVTTIPATPSTVVTTIPATPSTVVTTATATTTEEPWGGKIFPEIDAAKILARYGRPTTAEKDQVQVNVYVARGQTATRGYYDIYRNAGTPSYSELRNVYINPIQYGQGSPFAATLNRLWGTVAAPDLTEWWVGYPLRQNAELGQLVDLTEVWDNHKDEYTEGTRQIYSVDGVPYACPQITANWLIWYNPETFSKHGVEPPETWNDFLDLLEDLKNAGVTWPTFMPFVDWTGFIWYMELLIRTDPDFYEDLVVGKAKYTDPPSVEVMEIWQDMLNKGYFGDVQKAAAPGFALYPIAPQFPEWWLNGEIGTLAVADWVVSHFNAANISTDKYDFFVLPNPKPEVGKTVAVEGVPWCAGKGAANEEFAIEMLDYWMAPEIYEIWATRVFPQVFPNTKIPVENLKNSVLEREAAFFSEPGWRYLTRYWEAAPLEIVPSAALIWDKFAFNPDQLDQTLQELQKLADDFWAETPP